MAHPFPARKHDCALCIRVFLIAERFVEVPDEAYDFACTSLLSNPANRLGTVKLLSCLGGSCTRNLCKTAGLAGTCGGLIFDDRAIGTDGLCTAVHFYAHSDVELRQWQRCELHSVCASGVRPQSAAVHPTQHVEGGRWYRRLLGDCEVP